MAIHLIVRQRAEDLMLLVTVGGEGGEGGVEPLAIGPAIACGSGACVATSVLFAWPCRSLGMAPAARARASLRVKDSHSCTDAPSAAELLSALEAAGKTGEPPKGLAEEVQSFLQPLLSLPGASAAPADTAKRLAPFLIKAMKLTFEPLGKAKLGSSQQSVMAKCACLTIDGLRRARLAVKGRPLEIELQTYALVRKLVAAGLHELAAEYSGLLYAGTAEHCGQEAAPGPVGRWPLPPPTSAPHDSQAPGLLVCAVLNVVICIVEAKEDSAAMRMVDQVSGALSGIGRWVR